MYVLNPHPSPCLFVFFLEQSVPPQTINLNWSYAAPASKEALTIYQDRLFPSFSCVYHYHQF